MIVPFCEDDFLATREIRADDNIKTRLTGELPEWATALRQPQSGSVIRGGASSVASPPGDVGSRNTPGIFTSSEDGLNLNSSSSDGIYFTPDYIPPFTQAPARSPSPAPAAATGGFTITIPAPKQKDLGSPAPISSQTRNKLKKQFLVAKAKAAAEKALASAYVPPETPNTSESSAPLFSPYTTKLFALTDQLHADVIALPSLTPRIEALGTVMPTHTASGPVSGPSELSTTHSDMPSAASNFAGTSSGSRSAPTADAVTGSVNRKGSASVLKKRVVHEISSDNDADEEGPFTPSVKQFGKGKGKGKAAPSTSKKNPGSGSLQKKRKSSD